MPEVDRETVFTNYASIASRQFSISLLVEFVGVLIFSFLGTTVDDKIMGPWVNGLALAIMIYTAANISGGHLNPAVTMSTLLCGFYPVLHSMLYIILQISGSIFGSLLAGALLPGTTIGSPTGAPGCFDTRAKNPSITNGQLFGWEVVMTFTLISVVYACGVAKPGHSSFTPLAVGLSLVVCAGAGGQYTGAALNPARVIGPLAVFRCGKESAWIYILAELLAAALACFIFSFVSGWGPLFPFKSTRDFNMSWPDAIHMWVTGQPPKKFCTDGDENVHDVLAQLNRMTSSKRRSFLATPTSFANSMIKSIRSLGGRSTASGNRGVGVAAAAAAAAADRDSAASPTPKTDLE